MEEMMFRILVVVLSLILLVVVAIILGKIEVTRVSAMIADASWLKKDTIMHRC